ncbi:MAG TPA: 16S rRNA (adenine(1518)-N(6)/adenine(1519)-N(6))-dimethyltransferase RsmA [Terriglobia bacterium]|nr:16S rRNA (adenine(1518)-N(6)/adenine(1519)-N(6))-dimethyltransferase RsmA [Terriglobia bacterium]
MRTQRGRPKLGQHFLSSADYCRRIAQSLLLAADDLVIEIGPGRGALTKLLAGRVERLAAIELDATLAGSLRQTFENVPSVEIIEGDILKTDIAQICRCHKKDSCIVFGNLPYYITSPILHHLFEARARIQRMALLVQKEVAERITAGPGSRDYGYLSVFVQIHSSPTIAFDIPPGAFSPPPKVYSALVDFQMVPRFPAWNAGKNRDFLAFVRTCFAQKRKNLLNNLAIYARPAVGHALESMTLSARVRAEQLSLDQFGALFDLLAQPSATRQLKEGSEMAE